MMRVLMLEGLAQRLFAQTTHRHGWRVTLEISALMAMLAAGALLCPLIRAYPSARTINLTSLGGPAGVDTAGVYNVEPDLGYAWSSGYALMQIRNGYHAAPLYQAAVRLRADNPQGPQPLTFLANQQALATVSPTTSFRTYHVILPVSAEGDGSLRFAFETPTFTPTDNPRQLGVILTRITLQPLPSIDWSFALLVGFLLALLWGWLRWRGSTARATLLICSVLMVVLLALYGLYLPTPLSFSILALFAAGATAIGAVLAREPASQLALAALAVLVGFSGMLWPSWMTDDAFISFRYAQNLIAGHGLVYNVGERVEGYTNFLWTMLAAGGLWLGGDLVLLSFLAGVAIGLAIMLLTYWLGRRLLGPAWALAATLIVATSQSMLVYTGRGSGLETGLFTLLALAGSACAIHPQTRRWSGVILALATLTRPEGMLLMGLTCLWLLGVAYSQHVRRSIREYLALLMPVVAGYLLIFAPYFLWRTIYYGDLLPNTFYAKTGGGLKQVLRGLIYAGQFALALGGPLVLVSFVSLARDWRTALRNWQGYFLLLIVVYTLYIIGIGGDHFPGDRFFVPLVPWFALAMADGSARLYEAARRASWARRLAPAALAAILLGFSANALFRGADFNAIIRGDDESVWIWRELGWWFQDNGRPGESMAALGAGAVAYYSDRAIVDLLGLTDKHIARMQSRDFGSGTAGHEKRDPAYVLDVRRPTYIPQIWEEYFGGGGGLRDHYTLVTIHTRYRREMKLWKRVR